MGSYAYCQNKDCQCSLDKPTMQQILRPHLYPYTCPRCGKEATHHEDVVDVIEELEERIKALEAMVVP